MKQTKMTGSVIRWLLQASKRKAPGPQNKITIYHDTNSLLSQHLLGRLHRYSLMPSTTGRFDHGENKSKSAKAMWTNAVAASKFAVEVGLQPTFGEYKFIHEQCMGMHPGNSEAFESAFPSLFRLRNLTLCNRTAKTDKLQRTYVPDLEVLLEREYGQLADQEVFFQGPLVVDWANYLLASDDKGLDRIMSNYLACGTQDYGQAFVHTHLGDKGLTTVPSASNWKKANAVHPHVAEFADLF